MKWAPELVCCGGEGCGSRNFAVFLKNTGRDTKKSRQGQKQGAI